MIARLTLGASGPRLGGRRRGRRGPLWTLVVVSQELYCESAAGEWSGVAADAAVLEATHRGRSCTRRYTASGALLGCVNGAGLRGLLVPEEAVRDAVDRGALRSMPRLRRAGRLIRLVRARFRQRGRTRLVVARTALVAVFLTSIVTLVIASGGATEARAALARAEAVNAELSARTETLARLRDEAARLQSDGSGLPPMLPGRLMTALVSTLAPGERIAAVAMDGYDLTLVVEGDLAIVTRIDSLDRVRANGHTVVERDGTSVITIRARQEGGDR